MKFFAPPYETPESLDAKLKSMYEDVQLSQVKGIACFVCRKGIAGCRFFGWLKILIADLRDLLEILRSHHRWFGRLC